MNNKLKKILLSTLAVTLATTTVLTTGIVANAKELQAVEKTENENGEVVVQASDKTTDYVTVADKVEEITPEVQAEPVLTANSVEEIKTTEPEVTNPESKFASCRIIITSPTDMEFREESLGKDSIKSVTRFDDKYIVEYRSCHDTEMAYSFYTGLGYEVEIDIVQDTPEGVDNKDVRDNEVRKEEIASTDEVKPTQPIEEVNTNEEQHTIVVAVLDTGLNDGEEIFNDKVVQGKNFIDETDTEVKDIDTHGTTMARIVLESVNDKNKDSNIKIMPIKVLNDEGKGTTLTAYKGIKYVIEKKQQNPNLDFIINLSMSGIGHSKLLESAINEAYNNNIPVVVSAGNDNKEITEYTPANIDSAFTITSSNKEVVENQEPTYTKAVYSNFGSATNKVDYTTNGHYEYKRNINNKDVITKVDGTSVSSAYVSSYIALLKQMALTDEDENNNDLTISDVDKSLTESVVILNDEKDFGRGYLTKENITPKKAEVVVEESLPVEDVSNVEENIELNKNAVIVYIRYDNNNIFGVNWWHFTDTPDTPWDWGGFHAGSNESLTAAYNDAMFKLVWELKITNIEFRLYHDIYVDGNCQTWSLNGNGETIKIDGRGHKIAATGDSERYAYQALMVINNCPNITITNLTLSGEGQDFGHNAWKSGPGGLMFIANSGVTMKSCLICFVKDHMSGHPFTACGQHDGGGSFLGVGSNTTFSMSNCSAVGISEVLIGPLNAQNVTNVNITLDNLNTTAVGELWLWNGENGANTHSYGVNLTINGGNLTSGYCGEQYDNEYISRYGNAVIMHSALHMTGKVELNNVNMKVGNKHDLLAVTVTQGINNSSFSINGGTYEGVVAINNMGNTMKLSTYNGNPVEVKNSAIGVATQGFGALTIDTGNSVNIHDNIIGVSNLSLNTCTIKGGSISSNGTGIDNSATLTMTGGSIYNNAACGVKNNGTVNQNGGNIFNNCGVDSYFDYKYYADTYADLYRAYGYNYDKLYNHYINQGGPKENRKCSANPDVVPNGIYQGGTYNYYGGTINANNSVYLLSGKVINLYATPSSSIYLTTATTDRKVGRKLVTASSQALADANGSRFRLAFANPANDSYDNDNDFDGIANTAAVRVGNDTNITKGNMCLSAMYAVSYKGLLDAPNRLYSYNPDDNTFYWKEQVNETGLAGTSKAVYLNDNGSETDLSADGTGEYEFVGWCEDSNGNGTIYTEIRQEWLDRNKPYYAIYRRGKAKVTYNPNGAVDKNGKAYEPFKEDEQTKLREDYTTKDGSIFGEKQTKDGYIERQQQVNDYVTNHIYYITNKDEVVNTKGSDEDLYSFQGWSVIDYATSSKAEEIIYNGLTKFYNLYFDETAALNLGYTRQPTGVALGTIVGKIVKHRNDNINALNNRQLGDLNKILEATGIVDVYAVWDKYPTIETRTFNISSKDAENLTDQLLLDKIKVTDEEDGTISKDKIKLIYDKDQIVGLAEQGTCYTSITVVAEDSAGNVTKKVIMIGVNQVNPVGRNEQGFIRFISREAFEKSEADGGPLENSIWRTDEEYRKTMLENFDNLENDTPEQRWNFTHDQVLEVQDYIKANGFGKSKSNESLENFYNKFAGEGCLTENRKGV